MRIRIQKNPPSGTIVLDVPSTRNALSRNVLLDLMEAFGDFHREKSVRAVVLTASGKTFSSGVDLKEWKEISDGKDPLEDWRDTVGELQELVEIMLRFPKPIIAAVDGPVMGAGLALLLASDLVVASPDASFTSNACRFGLVSGLVAPLAVFRLGGAFAARLLLPNDGISADRAHTMGLVHYLVSSEQIWAKSHELASQISQTSAESVQMTKRLLNEMVGETTWTHLASGSAVMATMCSTDSAIEGLRAFSEKRTPKFL